MAMEASSSSKTVKRQKESSRRLKVLCSIPFITGCISLHILVRLLVTRPSNQISDIDGRRKCSRLVLFLHIHKAGGTSVLKFMHDSNYIGICEANAHLKPPLAQLMSTTNTTIPQYGMCGDACDQILTTGIIGMLPPRRCSRKGTSFLSRPMPDMPPLQLNDVSLWRGIHTSGVDYVAFEYNFLPPSVFVDFFDDIRPTIASLAVLREPWARFHSTYQRELYRMCFGRWTRKQKNQCIESNSLEAWMGISNPLHPNPAYPGILKPNYVVRMLNGITDQPNLILTQDHLEIAKVALEQIDLILYPEMPDRVELKHVSNNHLKKTPIYGEVIAISSLSQDAFYKLNAFDVELFEFTKMLVERQRLKPAVQC